MEKYILVDIDDTIRDTSHRYELREKIVKLTEMKKKYEKKSSQAIELNEKINEMWNDFFDAGSKDEPRKDMIELINMFYDSGYKVLFRTGGSEVYRADTEQYFKENGVKYNELRMRKENVKLKDFVLKGAWVKKYDNVENIVATYDDREQVNAEYNKKGIKNTFLVTKDFDVKKHIQELKNDYGIDLLAEKKELKNETKKALKPKIY